MISDHKRPARMMADEPPTKKAKIGDATVDHVWEHFRNFIEEDSVDELHEMMSLIPVASVSSEGRASSSSESLFSMKSREDMLPILWSIAYAAIAEEAMSEYFAISSAGSANALLEDRNAILKELRDTIVINVRHSLKYFEENPVPWSLAANFARTNGYSNPSHTASWYLHAANCSAKLRSAAIGCIDDSETSDDLKEWLELLVLNHACGVEVTEEDTWSSSAVESTSRFMATMILSSLRCHDEAAEQLAFFPTISHRIHPNVWDESTAQPQTSSTPSVRTDPFECPSFFDTPVLPPNLYSRLCKVFAPEAAYWTESDYDTRGYYSYYANMPEDNEGFKPTNAIDDAILGHLFPRIREHVGEETASSIVGYEWWVHTRPVSASLGHNLHFDTDESKLAADGSITHPLLSSVLYLTSPPISGPTIVFQQSPDARENASSAWYCRPKDNSFMTFPGNLLHGVLPCATADPPEKVEILTDKNHLQNTMLKACAESHLTHSPEHRLSFMVGFWTRRVPDEMDEQKLYGPCGPLPSPGEAEWVKELQADYPKRKVSESQIAKDLSPSQLPTVGPGWETLPRQLSEKDQGLEIPRAIDHRFFVADAPKCFRDCLFEKDEDDDDLSVIDIGEDSSKEED